jgi:hypothetical protein
MVLVLELGLVVSCASTQLNVLGQKSNLNCVTLSFLISLVKKMFLFMIKRGHGTKCPGPCEIVVNNGLLNQRFSHM